MHVVVIGGGVGGLSAGLGLARNGHRVTILERDPAPGDVHVEQAFGGWRRKGVPQIRQGHIVLGRAMDMLDRHAPDVLEALAEQGIVPPYNPLLLLLSEDELEPEDAYLRPLPTRRIPFELTLRRVVEAEPAIDVRSGVKVVGVSTEMSGGRPLVRGVGLEDGTEVEADFVVDAGGNKSRVQSWLRAAGANLPIEQKQDSGVTYIGRYYRAKGEAPDPWAIMQSSGKTPYLEYVVFPGDGGTYGVVFFVPSWDVGLRALREENAFAKAASMFSSVAPLVSEDFAVPINPVDVTASHNNVLRPFLTDGLPAYLGSLPVGDALGTTDARQGLGLSFALTHGFAAAAAIADHAGDPGDAALAYAAVVMDELQEFTTYASACSRISIRKWRGEPVEPRDADEQLATLASDVSVDVLFSDPVILRCRLRVAQLTDPPSALARNDAFVRAVRERTAASSDGSAPELGPPRDELLRVLSAQTTAVGG